MKRDDVLQRIADYTGLNATDLIAYANEDTIGGRDTGQWSGMSVFAAEGQIIYALVRALKPQRVVEIGVDSGGTSTHILTALERNAGGSLYSIDINPNCGFSIPDALRHRWTFTTGDALTAFLPTADLIIEDAAHTLDFTTGILRRLKALTPRAIVSHDYYTHETYPGFAVKDAWDQELPDGIGVRVDDAFTGLGVWFNPDWPPKPPQSEEVVPVAQPKSATKKAGKRG